MEKIKLVGFDVDGVLSDSLPAHLNFCKSVSNFMALGLNIPTADEFRRVTSRENKVTPMDNFLRAVGFPESRISEAFRHYATSFGRWPVKKFDGVDTLLSDVSAKYGMALVSSNTAKNVYSVLGDSINFFSPEFIFTHDAPGDKFNHLGQVIERYGCLPEEVLFVGDTPQDKAFAERARVNFVGAGYGGFTFVPEDSLNGFYVAKDMYDLRKYILSR